MAASAFLNHLSMPAPSKEMGVEMMCNLVRDLSSLISGGFSNGILASTEDFYSYHLADGYPLGQFYGDMVSSPNQRDIVLMLAQMTQRAPYLDELSAEVKSRIEYTEANLPDAPTCLEPDIFLAAHLTDGFMVSLPTEQCWDASIIRLVCQDCDEEFEAIGDSQQHDIPNLSSGDSREGIEDKYRQLFEAFCVENWDHLLCSFFAHQSFLKWLEDQTPFVQAKTMKKLAYIESLGPNPGHPHVIDVSDSFGNNYTVKEVRFSVDGNNEYRLLYEPLGHMKKHLLVGANKNNDSWYARMKGTVKARSSRQA